MTGKIGCALTCKVKQIEDSEGFKRGKSSRLHKYDHEQMELQLSKRIFKSN